MTYYILPTIIVFLFALFFGTRQGGISILGHILFAISLLCHWGATFILFGLMSLGEAWSGSSSGGGNILLFLLVGSALIVVIYPSIVFFATKRNIEANLSNQSLKRDEETAGVSE